MSISEMWIASDIMARALMAGVKCRPFGSGNKCVRLDRRTTRIPLAVSRTGELANMLSRNAKMEFPTRRMSGISLWEFSLQPRTTSVSLVNSWLQRGAKNLGSQVPSASRKPRRSASDFNHASLIAAP
jgi:hypothetical protein